MSNALALQEITESIKEESVGTQKGLNKIKREVAKKYKLKKK